MTIQTEGLARNLASLLCSVGQKEEIRTDNQNWEESSVVTTYFGLG